MSKKTKKILIFMGLGLDITVTIFLFVISIIMLATMPSQENLKIADTINGPFIGYLQMNPTVYLCACVIPLFVLLALNVVGLILYVRKVGKQKTQLSDLSEEQKAALKAELLKDVKSEEDKKE